MFTIEKKEVSSKYTITFDAMGGTLSSTSARTGVDGTLLSLIEPVVNGSTFEGWDMDAKGGNKVTKDTIFTQDCTIGMIRHV